MSASHLLFALLALPSRRYRHVAPEEQAALAAKLRRQQETAAQLAAQVEQRQRLAAEEKARLAAMAAAEEQRVEKERTGASLVGLGSGSG